MFFVGALTGAIVLFTALAIVAFEQQKRKKNND